MFLCYNLLLLIIYKERNKDPSLELVFFFFFFFFFFFLCLLIFYTGTNLLYAITMMYKERKRYTLWNSFFILLPAVTNDKQGKKIKRLARICSFMPLLAITNDISGKKISLELGLGFCYLMFYTVSKHLLAVPNDL